MLQFTTEHINEVVKCTAPLQAGVYLNIDMIWEQAKAG